MYIRVICLFSLVLICSMLLVSRDALSEDSVRTYTSKIKTLSDEGEDFVAKLALIKSLQSDPIEIRRQVAKEILPLYYSQAVPLDSTRLHMILCPLIESLDATTEEDSSILNHIIQQNKLALYSIRQNAAKQIIYSLPKYASEGTPEGKSKVLLSFIYGIPEKKGNRTADQEALCAAAIALLRDMPPSVLPALESEVATLSKETDPDKISMIRNIQEWIKTGQAKLTPKQRQSILNEKCYNGFIDAVNQNSAIDINTKLTQYTKIFILS